MREESDKLCREFGVSVVENPKNKRTNRYIALLHQEQEGQYTVYAAIKHDIDFVIAASPKDFDEFA